MMVGIDTNILLYSLNPASAWHGAAVDFLRQHSGVPSVRVALTDYVLVELYVHLRNPVVMARPLSAKIARDLAMSYLSEREVRRLPNIVGFGTFTIVLHITCVYAYSYGVGQPTDRVAKVVGTLRVPQPNHTRKG